MQKNKTVIYKVCFEETRERIKVKFYKSQLIREIT